MVYQQAAWLIAVAMSAICAVPVAANADMPKCFCLRHKATGSVAHCGCENVVPPNKATPETRCLNAAQTAKIRIENVTAYEVVPDGGDGCLPCVPAINGSRADTIRGDETKGGTNE